MARCLIVATLAPMLILGFGTEANARKGKAAKARPQEAPAPAPPAEAAVPPAEAGVPPAEAPAETEPVAWTEPPAAEAYVVPGPVNPPQFGVAARGRFIALPGAFLDAFTKANHSLLSYGVGIEGFRRKRDAENPNRFWELSLGVSYQNMSPPDGNWLGNGYNASIDTDWLQFKRPGSFTDFAFWTIDFSFIERQFFNDVVGIHYGAGLGLTIIQGKLLRTSSFGCTDQNLSTCRPSVCTGGVCTEAELVSSEKNGPVGSDSPTNPHRFREGSVPGAIPALTLLTGVDFRIPQAPGLELRIDAGLFDFLVLFIGGGIAYVFP